MIEPHLKKLPIKALKPRPCDQPADLTQFHVAAFQALERGDATPHQQKAALEFIINEMSGGYTLPYYPSDRDTAFGLGRAFVGQQIVGALKINLAYFTEKENR